MPRRKATRRALTEAVLRRRLRLYRRIYGEAPGRKPGQFRKRHPLDCGCTRCQLCHSDKVLDEPRRDELRIRQDMKEQRDELD